MTVLEDRIRRALAAEAHAWPDPTPAHADPSREAKPWAVALMAAAAVLVLVGGVPLLVSRLSDSSTPGAPPRTSEPVAAFSQAEVDSMAISAATYGVDVEEWWRRNPYGGQSMVAPTDADLTPELVDIVRAATSEALEAIDASPPYAARVINATEHGAWDILVTASYSAGRCLVIIDESEYGSSVCGGTEFGGAEPVMLGIDDTGWAIISDDATLAVDGWVSFVWWGLPPEATHVLYSTTSPVGAGSGTSAAPILDGTVRISQPVQGVEQQLYIEVRRSDDTVALNGSVVVPAFASDDDLQGEPDTRVTYDSDAAPFAPLIGASDTFLGGGYVLGEPWAIVGRTLAVEGKPTLQCTGVRPIRDEDVCDVVDGLHWMALPVGEVGGVLVFWAADDANVIRVFFEDGTTVEAPLVGGSAGYPPIAAIPIESAGVSGTAYAVGAGGQGLSARRFDVTEIVNPPG